MNGITTKDLSNQGDITAPQLSSSTPIYSPVNGDIPFSFTILENSYAISATGNGMSISLT